ncbi:MAG TPA: MBL fold metallo-hydrolase [Verrucomicrobiota bacterium]|nr:MBL fold metallo-hydrolase [Verrucomicrobiales bacterium]HRI15050.1 MBL fold metallo-hydrolase [Verrucomicrobiota bacterium]
MGEIELEVTSPSWGLTRTEGRPWNFPELHFNIGLPALQGHGLGVHVTNLNPDPDIGATSWLVECDGHRLLLDAGTHPQREGRESLPMYDRVGEAGVDAIALSHCHHDHVGSLPVALRHSPTAHVFMTDLSYFIVERVLHNSVNVMLRQREELGIREYPLFTHEEVDDYASVFQGISFRKEIEWVSFPRGRRGTSPTLEFFDAGHTLGSAGIRVRGRKQTLFFTGDVCFHDQTLLRAARFDGVKADVLIMETTRGNRSLDPGFSRKAEVSRLGDAIDSVLAAKGSVLIPAFGLGRTQEILAELAVWMRAGRWKPRPVHIGGLGRVFTEIYDLQAHRTNRSHPKLRLTEALDLKVLPPRELAQVKLADGKLFVLTAGMMSENTAAHDLAIRMIEDPKHAIFFVGYAAPESPAGRLRMSSQGERFIFSGSAGELTRRCRMEAFDLTAHANRDDLLDFVGQVDPKVVILGHGDGASREWFVHSIRSRWPQIRVLQPAPGATEVG